MSDETRQIRDGAQVRVVDHGDHELPAAAYGRDGQVGVVVGGLGDGLWRVRIEQNRGGHAGVQWQLHEDQLEIAS